MASDTMFKVGRGGAGNYHSATPVNKDSAASLVPTKSQIARAAQPPSAPAFSGRGGAGNVVSDHNAAVHTQGNVQDLESGGRRVTAKTEAAAAAAHQQQQRQPVRLGGRGGAGNWRDAAAEAAREKAAEEAEKSKLAEAKAQEAVDGELRMPAPTHHRVRHSERHH